MLLYSYARFQEVQCMPARFRNPLFTDLSPQDASLALRFFDAQEFAYPRGAFIRTSGDRMTRFGLVLSGTVEVSMHDMNGRQMVLNCVGEGQTFGEALCYLEKDAPLQIAALTDTRILWLRCDRLRQPPGGDFPAALHAEMQRRFTSILADRTLRMNDRIQILSRMSIRDKLRAFFTECARDAGSGCFTVPFNRSGMAAYLSVDRSALSRELSHMQHAGEITYNKNQFCLKNFPSVANATDLNR